MVYFRECIGRGILTEASKQTPLEVAGQLRETVLQSSPYMTMQQVEGAGRLSSRAGELWDRWGRGGIPECPVVPNE